MISLGLKQSQCARFKRFTGSVHGHGYAQRYSNRTISCEHSNKGDITVFIIYVDDIILTSNDISEFEKLKHILAKEFKIKDLGQLRYLLAMEIAILKNGIFVS
ncbi:unnamed protein product, partial [Musa acuminata var. zebrina]